MPSKLRQMIRRTASSRAARNVACSYFSFLSTSAWAFISIPLAVHYLDKEAIGLWSVINAILGYLTWMDFGISHATGRIMAPAVATNDQDEINRWWSAVSFALFGQCILIVLAGWSLIPAAIHFLELEGPLRSDATWMLGAGVLLVATNLPLRRVPGLLTAQERFHWVPLIMGIVPWFNLSIFYLCLRDGLGVKSYIIAMFGGLAVNWLLNSLVVRLGPQRPRFDRAGLTKERFKKLFSFGSGLMLFGVIDSFIQTLPTMLLARLSGLGIVPVYNFSAKSALLSSSLIARTYQAFQPAWQRSYVSKNLEVFRNQYNSGGYITAGMATCAGAGILIINPLFVRLLAGPQYLPENSVNTWLAISIVSTPIGFYLQSLINLSGSVGKIPWIFVGKLAISIPLGVYGWKLGGLPGIACVFALLPLINGICGYFLGNQKCGFDSHQRVGSGPALVAISAIVWMALTGHSVYESPTLATPDQWSFPTVGGIGCVTGALILGVLSVIWGFRLKKRIKTI